MAVTVFEEGVLRRYQAPIFSLSFCFHVVTVVGMVLVPFYVAFASKNFWLKTNVLFEQPLVQFKYDLLVIFQGLSSTNEVKTWSWATRPEIRDVYEPFLRAPVIRAWKNDFNKDSIPDQWTVTVQMPLDAGDKVHSVQSFMVFDYSLAGAAQIKMDGVAFIEHSSPLPGIGLMVDAEARLHQRNPLSVRRDNALGDLRLAKISTPASMREVSMQHLVSSYAKRNVSMTLGNKYSVWSVGDTLDTVAPIADSFNLNFTLRVVTDEIRYTPDVPEVLKVAWIQYFSFAALFFILFSLLRSFVFTNQVLETSVSLQGQTHYSRQKQHRF